MHQPDAVAAGNAPPRPSGVPYLLVAAVFWGANIPLTAQLFATFDPFFLTLVRIAMSVTVIGALTLAVEGPGSLRVTLPLWRWAGLTFTMASFFWLYNLSLAHVHPITAAAISAGSPVYAAVLLKLVARMGLPRGFGGAMVLALLGAGIAILGKAVASTSPIGLEGGEPVLIVSLCCWTFYSYIAQRWFPPEATQLQRTFVSMLGALFWLVIGWATLRIGGWVGPANLSPGPQAIAYLLMTGVFATALGSVAWNTGVNRSGLAVGSLWQNTVPVFSVLITMALGVMPSAWQVVGGMLVIAGVLYMQWQQRRGRGA